MRQTLLLLMLLFCGSVLLAQRTISGTVSDDSGEALIGVSVVVKGSTIGTATDVDGTYELSIPQAATTLQFSFIGYGTIELPVDDSDNIDAILIEGTILDEIVLIGSRSAGRTKLTTAVPVDLVDIKQLAAAGAQSNVNQLLNYVAPSFSSNTQTISDGTDHIDSASLRGLGPDQVLVLMLDTGERHHNTLEITSKPEDEIVAQS